MRIRLNPFLAWTCPHLAAKRNYSQCWRDFFCNALVMWGREPVGPMSPCYEAIPQGRCFRESVKSEFRLLFVLEGTRYVIRGIEAAAPPTEQVLYAPDDIAVICDLSNFFSLFL